MMTQNHTGTIYIFQESKSEKLLFKTTDTRTLQEVSLTNVIALDETIQFKDIKYVIVNIAIEISVSINSNPVKHPMQIGDNNPYGIETVIYIEKI